MYQRDKNSRVALLQFTFYVLNTQFFDESRWEDARCESTTEDRAELGVQTTDTHILEFEVGCQNSVWSGSTKESVF